MSLNIHYVNSPRSNFPLFRKTRYYHNIKSKVNLLKKERLTKSPLLNIMYIMRHNFKKQGVLLWLKN